MTCLARKGFTLVELMVAIAITGILAVALTTQVTKIQESARATQCEANLRTLTQVAPKYGVDSGTYFGDTGMKVDEVDLFAWLLANGLTPGQETAGMLTAFLLNVAPGDGTKEAKLIIKSIVPKSSGILDTDTSTTGPGATIKLAAINGMGLEQLFLKPNGVLRIYRKASLEDPWGAAYITELKPDTDTYDVAGNTDKYFYKATISDK